MYRLACITAIFCTLLLPFAPATAHARGEFSRTCSDFKYNDGILSANCRMHRGYVETTSINLNHLLFWHRRGGCAWEGSDNCCYLAWGQPVGGDVFLSGYNNGDVKGKSFDELDYWFSTTSSPLLLHGRACISSWFGLKKNCSDSDIDLDEHIANHDGTLEYVP